MGTSNNLNTIGIQSEAEIEYQNKVNHPAHYNQNDRLECIEQMVLLFGRQAVSDFCRCNIFKYQYRYVDTQNQTDLDKAEWYAQYLDKLVAEDNTQWGDAPIAF